MKENNVYYMQLAYKKAQLAYLNNNIPVGCVVTNKDNMIITKYNSGSKYKNQKHAEIECVNSLNNSINKNKIFLFSSMTPCPMCSGYLYMHNIRNIYIGTNSNNDLYNKNFSLLYNKYNKCISKKCSYILSVYFKNIR